MGKPNTPPGFTLVEIMVVVTLIGILATLAVPAFARVQQQTRVTLMVNLIQEVEHAIEQHYLEENEWPRNQRNNQDFPPDIADRLPPQYAQTTPIKGRFRLRVRTPHMPTNTEIILMIRSVGRNNRINATDAELTEIDRILDDGNLNTGKFRVVNRNRIWYTLKERGQNFIQ